jgi:hypothetical protein
VAQASEKALKRIPSLQFEWPLAVTKPPRERPETGADECPFMADSRRTQAAVAEMVEPQSHRRTFDEYSAYSLPNNDERMRSSGLIWNRVINTAKITGPSIAQTLRR